MSNDRNIPPVEGVELRFVTLPSGARASLERTGGAQRGEGGRSPTLVLLHGSGGNSAVLRPLLEQLAALGVAAVAPNRPGRLGSAGAPAATAAEAAEWLAGVIEALGLERVLLAGHSYGGGVAQEAALAASRGEPPWADRLAGVVLMGTGARLRVHPGILAAAAEAVARDEPMAVGAMAFHASTDPERIAAHDQAAALTPPAAVLADWEACDRFDRLGQLGGLQIPALVLAGASDPLTPLKYAQHLADAIPGARMRVWDDAGHMFVLERVEEVAAALAEELARVG